MQNWASRMTTFDVLRDKIFSCCIIILVDI